MEEKKNSADETVETANTVESTADTAQNTTTTKENKHSDQVFFSSMDSEENVVKREEIKLSFRDRFKLPKRRPIETVYRIFMIFAMSFLVAASYYIFTTPNSFAPGGIYGIGSMIENKTGFPQGIFVILVSIPLIIASFMVLDFESAIIITSLAVTTNVFEILMHQLGMPQYIAGDDKVTKIFAAAIGGALGGSTFGWTIKTFGTADGTIALAAIVRKKRPDVSMAWAVFALDAIVVASSLFVYWKNYTSGLPADANFGDKMVAALEPIMYSIINMFMVSYTCDLILKGGSSAYKFEIITTAPKHISEEIMTKLGRGVTAMPAKGMYSGNEKSMLVCIVSKRQIGDLQRIIKSYPDTFAYISSTNEVMGVFARR